MSSNDDVGLTPAGWIAVVLLVVTLASIFSMKYLVAESILAEFTVDSFGRLTLSLLAVAAFWVIEKTLNRFGIQFKKGAPKRANRP